MAEAGPYDITQVDIPGILAANDQRKMQRIQEMLLAQQADKSEYDFNKERAVDTAYKSAFTTPSNDTTTSSPDSGGVASNLSSAYGNPVSTPAASSSAPSTATPTPVSTALSSGSAIAPAGLAAAYAPVKTVALPASSSPQSPTNPSVAPATPASAPVTAATAFAQPADQSAAAPTGIDQGITVTAPSQAPARAMLQPNLDGIRALAATGPQGLAAAQQILTFNSTQLASAQTAAQKQLELEGQIVNGVMSAPPDQREAVYQQQKAQLVNSGAVPANALPQHWDEGQAQSILKSSLSYAQAVGLENTAAQQAETHRHNLVEEQKGVQDGFGNVVNPITGAVIYSQGNAGSTGPSLAQQNNNPGNIRDGAYAQSLPGYKGSNGGFAVFDTPASGQQAQLGLLNSYVQKGYDTPAKIAARWAPKGDGANDPTAYASSLAKAIGIGVNDKVTPAQLPALAQAQARIEGGAPSGGGSVGGLTSAAIDLAANKGLQMGGVVPPGYARNKAAMAAIQNRMAEIAAGQGKTVDQLAAGSAALKADTGSLATLEKQATTIRAAEDAAQKNAQLALGLSAQVGNGNIPTINAWVNAGRKATGDPAIASFNAAVDTFVNEYAKVMGGGTPTDSLRAHAHDVLNTAQSPQAFQSVVSTLSKDMQNRRAAFDEERQATINRISNPGGSQTASGSNGPAPKVPAGATKAANGPNGSKIYLVSGQWVDQNGNKIG